METIDEYRIKLKKIADYAFGHEVKSVGAEQFKIGTPDLWDKEILGDFLIACHDGFKIAQNLLIEETKKYQALLKASKDELKEYRRQRNKEKEKDIQAKIKIFKQRLSTLSHIADGIAWQLIDGQIHIARRFHIEQDAPKYLVSSNINHAIKVANCINKNPDNFALISDLTSFVQIGDLLVRDSKGIRVIELKEGKVNYEIENVLKAIDEEETAISESELKEQFNNRTIKQIKRVQRQKERAIRATNVINEDKGIDPVSGEQIIINTPSIDSDYYDEELFDLYKNLEKKIWSYTVIDSCLHIGMYRDEGILMAGFAIKEIIEETTENFIIVDWLSITKNLSEPIFAKPLPPDFIIDILTGKVKVILGLDMDSLIEIWNTIGLETRWMTKGETTRIRQNAIRKGIIEINKRGIVLKISDGEMIMYGGTISKILYDNIKPINIALSILSTIEDI